jgi:photosystem II stability/assembly factor-like uncharacterized protein
MKNAVLVITLLSFFSCKKNAEYFEPLAVMDVGTSCRVNDLHVLSSGRWIACSGERGERGFLSYSDNSGSTWQSNQTDQESSVYAVDFMDSLNGLAGGDFLHLWRTHDGGSTWSYYWLGEQVPINEEDRPAVRDIHLLNDSAWFFCGGENLGEGVVYQSENRGQSWQFIFRQHEFRAIIADASKIVAAGHGSILNTRADVNALVPVNFRNDFITGMLQLNDGSFLAVSTQGSVYKSTDGFTWSEVLKEKRINGKRTNWFCIELNGNQIFIAGAEGRLGVSSDEGATWSFQVVQNEPDIFTLTSDGNSLYAGGESGKIYKLQ